MKVLGSRVFLEALFVVLRLVLTFVSLTLFSSMLRSVPVHISYYVLLAAGCVAPSIPGKPGSHIRVISVVGGGVIAMTVILITPLSSYHVWFTLLERGEMHGAVSMCFVLLWGWLSMAILTGLRPVTQLRGRVAAQFHPLLLWIVAGILVLFVVLRWWWLPVVAVFLFSLLPLTSLVGRDRPHGAVRGAIGVFGLVTMAVAASYLFTTTDPPGGVPFIDRFLSDTLRRAVVRLVPQFPVLYGVPEYGYRFSTRDLGRRPALSERPILRVEGPPGAVLYLRELVYHTYTENRWIAALDDHIDTEEPEELPLVFSGSAPEAGPDEPPVTVQVLVDHYHYLVHPLETMYAVLDRADPNGETDAPVTRGDRSTGVVLDTPLQQGESFHIELDAARSTGDASGPRDPDRYLTVPASIDPAVRDLAEDLSRVPPDVVPAALAGLLGDGFSYTLETPPRRAGRDFVSDFLLFDRKGYCVHFATAAVILARMAGIPARYVTGYLAVIPGNDDMPIQPGRTPRVPTTVSGLNAHAWAELYLPQRGWVIVETTPPMTIFTPHWSERVAAAIVPGDYNARQIEAITGGRLTPSPRDVSNGRRRRLRFLTLPVSVVVLGVAIVFLFVIYPNRFQRRKGRSRTGQPLTREERRFHREVRRLVRATTRLDIEPPQRIGWIAWDRAVRELNDGTSTPPPLPPFGAIFFGRRRVTHTDVIATRTIADEVSRLRDWDNRDPASRR